MKATSTGVADYLLKALTGQSSILCSKADFLCSGIFQVLGLVPENIHLRKAHFHE